MKSILILFFLFLNLDCYSQSEEERLGIMYYEDFINPTEKLNHDYINFTGNIEEDSLIKKRIVVLNLENNTTSKFSNSAKLALDNFLKLWETNPDKREIIYYPIHQLGCYLKEDLKQIEKPSNNHFFPINLFTNFKKNWKCDFSIDYLFEIEISIEISEKLKVQLENLNEQSLNYSELKNKEIYRFTWLRSFHHPIAIRLENTNDKYYLFWKVGKGNGGFKPKGILEESKKEITKQEWEIFETLIEKEEYINIRNFQSYIIGDGSRWTLEAKNDGDYKVKSTCRPSLDLYKSCMYLIKLTGLIIPEKEDY